LKATGFYQPKSKGTDIKMENTNNRRSVTRQLLIEHYRSYPLLQAEDIFKYIFQSAFGCEHLVSDGETALAYIETEYADISVDQPPLIERLDGDYSRVHLSCLSSGLLPGTLAALFCLSSQKEENGGIRLQEMLSVATELVENGEINIDKADFEEKTEAWRKRDFCAVRHSEAFKKAYRPAYRVVANRYADFLRLFTEIDRLSSCDNVKVAIEGGSACGKTTIAEILQAVYDCNVFHMDDFFLRPEQRTPERFKEVGGNVDRERFAKEVLSSLKNNATVVYRPFDCSQRSLGAPVTVAPNRLTVVEGVYSMHPAFGRYYDLSVFLDISPEHQRERILKRNSPEFAARFFNEWIPLENLYFSETDIKTKVDAIIPIH